MARFEGKGAMTDVNLLLRVYDNAVTKDGKTQFADVQVDHRDKTRGKQSNAHLVSSRVKDEKTGQVRHNNTAAYSSGQIDQIVAAADEKTGIHPITNVDGEAIGRLIAIKASVMPSQKGNGVVINTNKPMGPSDFKTGPRTLDNQYKSMKEVSQAESAAREAAQANQPEAPAQEVQAEAEEQALGA